MTVGNCLADFASRHSHANTDKIIIAHKALIGYNCRTMNSSTLLFTAGALLIVGLLISRFARSWALDWLDAYTGSSNELWQNVEDRLKELSRRVRVDTPELFILPELSPNAFVFHGLQQQRGAIALTEGLLHTLTAAELEAILCLCLARYKHRNAKTASFLAACILPFCRGLDFLPRGFSFIFTPFLQMIFYRVSSPRKIFEMDAEAQKLLKEGKDLAAALQKMAVLSRKIPLRRWNLAFDHLFLVSPLQLQEDLLRFFPQYPSVDERREKILIRTLAC